MKKIFIIFVTVVCFFPVYANAKKCSNDWIWDYYANGAHKEDWESVGNNSKGEEIFLAKKSICQKEKELFVVNVKGMMTEKSRGQNKEAVYWLAIFFTRCNPKNKILGVDWYYVFGQNDKKITAFTMEGSMIVNPETLEEKIWNNVCAEKVLAK